MSTQTTTVPRSTSQRMLKRLPHMTAAWLLLAAFSASASSAGAFTPGLYEVTSEIAGTAGQSAQHITAEHCITDAKAINTSHLTKQFGIAQCRTTSQSITSGRISLQVQCGSGANRLTLTGNGTYTRTGYVLTSDIAMKLDNTAVRVTTRLNARRIGDC
ncbi:MAG: DUF3617 domain-containing protein [Pseudomonadaceae bacterium]|nr:DUF3617 domain-containing protein [Pseudomonadaceae bacterium]